MNINLNDKNHQCFSLVITEKTEISNNDCSFLQTYFKTLTRLKTTLLCLTAKPCQAYLSHSIKFVFNNYYFLSIRLEKCSRLATSINLTNCKNMIQENQGTSFNHRLCGSYSHTHSALQVFTSR